MREPEQKRAPTFCCTCLELGLSYRYWGQDEKCWCSAPLGKIVLQPEVGWNFHLTELWECGWSEFCFKYHRFELFSQSFGRFSWIYVFLHLLYALRTISRNFKCGFLKIIFTRESLRSTTCHHTGGRTRSQIVFKVISGSKMIVNWMKEFELYKYDYLWLLGFVNRQIAKVLSAYTLHNFYSTLQGWKLWWIWSLERLNNLLVITRM